MLINLKAEMARNGDTIIKMAKFLDISENTYRWKLRETREFSLDELRRLADYYNVSMDYLAGRNNKSA